MDNKHRPKQPARRVSTKASSSFNLADSFESDLLRVSQEQVSKIQLDRKNRINFDRLLATVIDQVLRCTVNLQPSEVAEATNRILGDLVKAGTIIGTLPSEERMQSAIRKHLRTRTDSTAASAVSTLTQTAPRTTLPSIPHSSQEVDAEQTRWAAEQNCTRE